MKPEIAEFMKR